MSILTLSFFNLLPLILTFFTCFISCAILIGLNHYIGIGVDKSTGVQKFHVSATSRLGGLALMCGLICAVFCVSDKSNTKYLFIQFLLACAPVFLAGTIEDITHEIAPSVRLILAFISSSLAYLLLEAKVIRTDVWLVDWLLQWPVFVYIFTILVISGFTHAINIIDGFNGLASGQILLMLGFLSYLNYTTQQFDLLLVSISLLCVTLGFFVWNWPLGKIFLGDGGAYLLGFIVVCLGLLLISRCPQVSPFTPIMLGIYPLIEAIFSMYRRRLIRGISITKPDAIHLHSLIYRRVIKSNLNTTSNPQLTNSKVAFIFWFITFIFGLLTCLSYTDTAHLLILLLSFIILYLNLFIRLVRFKTPRLIFIFI
jgi:UDP-N-acetylmuramyl pentapeptide phosphotransferase/UDP-N-acetylglucosamine-1-phosphate transferase